MVGLLEEEIQRLQENLETQRLLDHPQKARLVQNLIGEIERREDRLHQLKGMLAER